jgi:hypothetical protein
MRFLSILGRTTMVLLALTIFATCLMAFPTPGTYASVQQQSPLFLNGWSYGVSLSNNSGGSTFYGGSAGIFSMKWDEIPGPNGYEGFATVCMDPFESLFSGTQTHYVGTLTNYPTPPAEDGSDNSPDLSAVVGTGGLTKAALLRDLMGKYWGDAQTSAVKAAGFQIAVWEIVGETSTATALGLGAGTFRDLASSSATAQANTYLSGLNGSSSPELLVWSPVSGYSGTGIVRVPGQELLTMVPEPGFYGALALGLAGLYMVRRRRTA